MSCWSEPTSKHAFILSWISVILTGCAVVAGIGFFLSTGSALCLVFGLENCVDFLSSVVVLWRFYCPGKMTKERESLLQKREKRASIAISFILMLLGIGVIASATDDLLQGPETEYDLEIIMAIAFFSIFILGSLTVVKFRYANKLSSASLYKDGLCSLIGTILAVALFVNSLIIQKANNVWWLDPIVAIVCGCVALLLGLHGVIVASCVQGLPIFKLQWWFVSQGDGMDEMGARDLGPSDFGEQQDPDTTTNVEMKGTEAKTDTNLSEVV